MPNEEKHTLPYAYKAGNPKKVTAVIYIVILISSSLHS